MGERTHVLWLAKGLGPGGMERLLLTHARVADRDRFDFIVGYLVERPNSLRADLEAAGVPCVDVGKGRPEDPRWVLRVLRLVDELRIDVVHVHSPMVAAVLRPALRTRRHRPALVYTEHNSWSDYAAVTRAANRLTYGLDDRHVAVSAAARDSAPPRLRSGIELLVHGVELDGVRSRAGERGRVRRELGLTDDEVLVGAVANLRPQKNYPLLLDAARHVVDRREGVRFVALGHGPLEHELVARRDELGLGDRFSFLGHVPDAPAVMSAFDVFVLSSDVEGLPVALMEACALGLPVVATAVGGVPQVVDESIGRLVPPGRVGPLADAIVELADDPALRRRLGAAAAERSGRFDARVAVRRIEELYAEAAG
ncbi:glycosyltransferase [Dermatobacter hominis]|uniref:glycosyltransferase n=1 Tax=Dermatobacter hominis TaxID=2884263 RepID=UPI001D11BB61|nr:glycosyltransferase [Dermatobacter hominis]UDY33930.1 glycosyltransferase [Dermatobacter hominis]